MSQHHLPYVNVMKMLDVWEWDRRQKILKCEAVLTRKKPSKLEERTQTDPCSVVRIEFAVSVVMLSIQLESSRENESFGICEQRWHLKKRSFHFFHSSPITHRLCFCWSAGSWFGKVEQRPPTESC
jgi:hypothetical protein